MWMKGVEWPGWDLFLCHRGKTWRKNLKEICICAWPLLPQRASECWYLAIKYGSMKGMQVEMDRNELRYFSSLISCLCFTSVMLFHSLHSDSRYYMEENLCLTSIFLSRGLFENLQNQTFLKNIRANLDVDLNTKRLWAISGHCLLDSLDSLDCLNRTIKCVTGEKHANWILKGKSCKILKLCFRELEIQ